MSNKEQLEDTFIFYCKKAKVIFRNDSLTADKLAITDSMPKWLEVATKFYSIASSDSAINGKLARF